MTGVIEPCDASDTLAKPCYDYKGLSRTRAFLEKLTESMRAAGIDVYQIDHEDANGQFEINYTYTDCLTSCDHYVFFKMAASEIANEMGMICSFMPKPFANRPGNGMHMHMSIGDGVSNLFSDKSDPSGMGLSKLAYQFTAGLLAHAPALTALCNPTVNSYKRLVVGRSLTGATWAPAYISYGDNNRSTMVRVPGERIELRLPDGACNPYLATAAVDLRRASTRRGPGIVSRRTGEMATSTSGRRRSCGNMASACCRRTLSMRWTHSRATA